MNGDKAAIASAYHPIIRGYFAVAAVYYALMTVSHLWFTQAHTFWTYTILSAASAITIFGAHRILNNTRNYDQISRLTLFVNAIVLTNIVVALELEFAEAKLTYFVVVALVFGLTSLSVRHAALSVGVALFCLGIELYKLDSDQAATHGIVAFAAAISAASISHYFRRAIQTASLAEIAANTAMKSAQSKLSKEISAAQVLKRKSLSDSLTGLPNRRAFFDAFEAQGETRNYGWVGLLDLDGFKNVNDNYGHAMGDALLKTVGTRLRSYCGELAQVSRIGGDEFALLIQYDLPEEQLQVWANKLLTRISRAYPIEGRLINVSGSLGFCEIGSVRDQSSLMKSADFALLHAKRSGKNRMVIFNREHAKAFEEHSRLEHALRDADFDREIDLVFQPQLDLRSQSIVRAEALARWNSPALGSVPPTEFIRVAEEAGLVSDISIAVMRKAIHTLEGWAEPVPLAINLSASDLNCDHTVSEILRLLDASDVNPAMVEFEVTESAMFEDMAKATQNIQRFAKRGHAIAIDDFGTGYSNFNYLRELPITKLKIDRSFLDDLDDPVTEKILRSLAGIAQTLEVECLLEGVEDQLGLLAAKRCGIDIVQGYLVGMPVSQDGLRTLDVTMASA